MRAIILTLLLVSPALGQITSVYYEQTGGVAFISIPEGTDWIRMYIDPPWEGMDSVTWRPKDPVFGNKPNFWTDKWFGSGWMAMTDWKSSVGFPTSAWIGRIMAPGISDQLPDPTINDDPVQGLFFNSDYFVINWPQIRTDYYRNARVMVLGPIAGDLDGDGDMDGRDILAWQLGDLTDRQSLYDARGNLGRVLPAATATVPEPDAVWLLVVGLFLLIGKYHKYKLDT